MTCTECRFIHKKIVTIKEAVQILGVSAKEVEKMIDGKELRIRVQFDSIGRLRFLYVDILSLWQFQSNTRSTMGQ